MSIFVLLILVITLSGSFLNSIKIFVCFFFYLASIGALTNQRAERHVWEKITLSKR